VARRRLVRELLKKQPAHVIDIATGTADLAILAVKKGVSKVTGIDLSEGMVSVGLQKVAEKKLNDSIDLIVSDAEKIPFDEATFDAAMVAFGIRNFEDLDKG
jgi:demethylmenaquinone methyltransferase/2-methoxy-6-polyprenyl-1,4-benzoquinol methylase